MSLSIFTHDSGLTHDTGPGHPERIDRLVSVLAALEEEPFNACPRGPVPKASREQLERVHEPVYVEGVLASIPEKGLRRLDGDTVISPGSGDAALYAAGAAIAAVEHVLTAPEGEAARRAFVATRPPGHHAEPGQAMGFCLFNNVAIAAAHAIAEYGVSRVAIVDFDVHHGNGTQTVANNRADIFYASLHQYPLFPGTGLPQETGMDRNVLNILMRESSTGAEYRRAFDETLLPALEEYLPELLIISAGFDAHERDPLAGIMLTDEDFGWMTRRLREVAEAHAKGRLVSVLEGGYDLHALASGVRAHLSELI